jgi:outer membrane protein OmpA-like peptidoglycan-associated protein
MRPVSLALATLAVGLPPGTPAFATPLAAEAEGVTAAPTLLAVSDASAPSAMSGSSSSADGTARAAAATAFAAPLHASEDTCMRSHSVGLQAIGFGFSIASTREDAQCRRLHNARALDELGYREAALQLLCFDKEVHRAMRQAGTPCVQSARLMQSPPPPPAEPAAEPPPIASYAVLFDFDKYNLRSGAEEILAPLLASLQADPTLNVDIEGHTDWVGSDAYNLRLSQRRAQAVVNWLIAHGIARERMRAFGRGEREPIASNETAAGRQMNRRTEVRRWQ